MTGDFAVIGTNSDDESSYTFPQQQPNRKSEPFSAQSLVRVIADSTPERLQEHQGVNATTASHALSSSSKTRKKLVETAQLDAAGEDALANLTYLGVSLKKASLKAKLLAAAAGSKKKKGKAAIEDEVPYELSRFQPVLRDIIENLVNDELSETQYPRSAAAADDDDDDDDLAAAKKKKAAKAGGVLRLLQNVTAKLICNSITRRCSASSQQHQTG